MVPFVSSDRTRQHPGSPPWGAQGHPGLSPAVYGLPPAHTSGVGWRDLWEDRLSAWGSPADQQLPRHVPGYEKHCFVETRPDGTRGAKEEVGPREVP